MTRRIKVRGNQFQPRSYDIRYKGGVGDNEDDCSRLSNLDVHMRFYQIYILFIQLQLAPVGNAFPLNAGEAPKRACH